MQWSFVFTPTLFQFVLPQMMYGGAPRKWWPAPVQVKKWAGKGEPKRRPRPQSSPAWPGKGKGKAEPTAPSASCPRNAECEEPPKGVWAERAGESFVQTRVAELETELKTQTRAASWPATKKTWARAPPCPASTMEKEDPSVAGQQGEASKDDGNSASSSTQEPKPKQPTYEFREINNAATKRAKKMADDIHGHAKQAVENASPVVRPKAELDIGDRLGWGGGEHSAKITKELFQEWKNKLSHPQKQHDKCREHQGRRRMLQADAWSQLVYRGRVGSAAEARPEPKFNSGQSVIQWWAPWMANAEQLPKHYNNKNRPSWFSAEILTYIGWKEDKMYCGVPHTGHFFAVY